MQTIVNQSGLPKHRATECLNALVHSKDVIKVNKKVKYHVMNAMEGHRMNNSCSNNAGSIMSL